MVPLLDRRLLHPVYAVPDHVALGPLAVVVLVVVVVEPIVHAVAVRVVAFLALPMVPGISAVVVPHVVGFLLPLHAVIGKSEWRWWLLARSIESESLPEDVILPVLPLL